MPLIQFIEQKRSVEVPCDSARQSLLDASLDAGLPHFHACGGLGRCTTCRVLVIEGLAAFGPRLENEEELAAQRRWPDAIRLACCGYPSGPATVRRVIEDELDADLSCVECSSWPAAEERELALLFCDITQFTAIAEHHLAYDVIHSLNRFFKQMGDPILANGGMINKYLGDGLLALFGMDEISREETCRRAIQASLRMLASAETLNRYLDAHFGFVFKPRIGLHFGRVLAGQIGHPDKIDFTVIGDAVNTASRIEAANKRFGTQLLASAALVEPVQASLNVRQVSHVSRLRGRNERLQLFEILGFRDPALLGQR